jgi:hypothetical protein
MKQYRLLYLLPLLLVSCRNNPVEEVQGTFESDKAALKLVMQQEVKSDNVLTERRSIKELMTKLYNSRNWNGI